jgi:hypothetical protein
MIIIDWDAGTLAIEEDGVVIENARPMTDYERALFGPSSVDVARASAVAKLQALGLTEAEALALVGS